MTKAWQSELRMAIAGLAACLIAGWVFGRPLLFIFLGIGGYLIWQLVNLHRLLRFLNDDEADIPQSAGLWSVVVERVRWMRSRDRKRQELVRKTITDVRQAASAMPDAAVILRDDGEIAWFNESATKFLGLRHPQDIGQPIPNLVRDPSFAEYLEQRRFTEALELVSPMDENIRLLLRLIPYGPDRNLLLARDVTRIHRLEQMRKDFVANVSHELRSPLTVILGYLETLREDQNGKDAPQRPLEQMWEQAQRMFHIVEDLLRLSNIENQPGGAPKTEVRVAEMLARIRESARKLSDGDHEIDLTADSRVGLLGDYNELYSAFSNLVFNAIQYTPKGGKISLSWGNKDSGARLEVSDTGIGIDPHHLPRLTERFYRADKARSREVGGTGLGLAIVKHVLMRHDAELAIESIKGEGSKFKCDFPAERTLITCQRSTRAAEV